MTFGGDKWNFLREGDLRSPQANATKVWITKAGKCLLANNNSDIPRVALRNIMRIIEARSTEVVNKWYSFYGEIEYYC